MALVTLNAFDLILTSQGLNLGTLFEKPMCLIKQETIFTLKHPTNEIIKKIEKTIMPLVFNVKKNNFNMKLEGEKFGCKGHFVYCNRGISLLVALFAGSPDHEFIGTLPEDVSTGCQ
ncbi:unnamed protein product, partial [Vitis vinifera]|uniref:NAF domain-containing protein n=1 Tax=Vitis vinifera TaxID=29760 RepID=D7SYX9_VITVI